AAGSTRVDPESPWSDPTATLGSGRGASGDGGRGAVALRPEHGAEGSREPADALVDRVVVREREAQPQARLLGFLRERGAAGRDADADARRLGVEGPLVDPPPQGHPDAVPAERLEQVVLAGELLLERLPHRRGAPGVERADAFEQPVVIAGGEVVRGDVLV